MQYILISSCLIGNKVRYDGGHCKVSDQCIQSWQNAKVLVPLCPEVHSGLPVPRLSAEVRNYSAISTMQEKTKVFDKENSDITHNYIEGAKAALRLCNKFSIKMAILKEYSPSCGVQKIYDGNFSGRKIKGMGVTTSHLLQNGIKVFSEYQIQEALEYYKILTGLNPSAV